MNDVEKVVARLVVHGVNNMDNQTAAEIARWLRRTAKMLVRERDQMDSDFRAAYVVYHREEDNNA